MSQENVAIVQRAWELWSAGDIEAMLEFFDPAVEWDATHYEGWPEEIGSGKDNVHRFFVEWRASWDGFETGADEYVDVDDGRVLVICWQRGVGSGSQAEVRMEWAQILTVRNRLVVRMENYSSRAEARETVRARPELP